MNDSKCEISICGKLSLNYWDITQEITIHDPPKQFSKANQVKL